MVTIENQLEARERALTRGRMSKLAFFQICYVKMEVSVHEKFV